MKRSIELPVTRNVAIPTMKNTIRSLFVLFIAMVLVAEAPAQAQRQSVQQVYDQAVKEFEAQNYEAAKAGFQKVLRSRPGYVYARNYLAKTESALKNPPPSTDTLEKKLAAIVVPKFTFEDATLGDILRYLTQKSEELSEGKVVANFIYKGPPADRENKALTLNLANLPMTEVIRYVGLQTGTRFTYEKYAVVGTPVGQAADESAQTQEASLQTAPATKSIFQQRAEKEAASKDPFK